MLTAPERVRQQIADRLTPELATLLYRVDKGSLSAELTDLRDPALAVYVAAVLELLSPEGIKVRIVKVQQAEAYVHATKVDEGQDVIRQARADIARFDAAHFGTVAPGTCERCKTRIQMPSKGVTLFLSESIKADVHMACIANEVDAGTIERVGPFAFRMAGQS